MEQRDQGYLWVILGLYKVSNKTNNSKGIVLAEAEIINKHIINFKRYNARYESKKKNL